MFNNIYLRRCLVLFMLVAVLSSLCACSGRTSEETIDPTVVTPSYTVGVVQDDDTADSKNTYNGFLRAFSDKGYKEADNLSVSVTVVDNDKKEAKAAAEKYVSENVDLIFAIGEVSAKAAAKATSEIPIIFACVADPIEAGLLTSCEKPDKNITGVSDFTPVHKQLELIKELYPEAKKIKGLYYGLDAESVLTSELTKTEADELDLRYIPYSASTKKEFTEVLKKCVAKTDALYLIEDEVAITFTEEIIKAANKKKTPVFSTDDGLLDAGCLATAKPDYEDIGFNAGDLALIVLRDLKPIGEIAVEYPAKCINYISSSAAEKLSLDISAFDDAIIVD